MLPKMFVSLRFDCIIIFFDKRKLINRYWQEWYIPNRHDPRNTEDVRSSQEQQTSHRDTSTVVPTREARQLWKPVICSLQNSLICQKKKKKKKKKRGGWGGWGGGREKSRECHNNKPQHHPQPQPPPPPPSPSPEHQEENQIHK